MRIIENEQISINGKYINIKNKLTMTQVKIISRQPSIQNIQYKAQGLNKTLSSLDVNRLFKAPTLPKFELMDIKDQHIFYKRQKAQFFINKLQSWNRQIEEGQKNVLNSRTQFLFIQFIYSSMKRICLMNEHQIDKQLEMLYKWYTIQAKKCGGSHNAAMPEKFNLHQYYDVTKSFKTNPTLLLDQYRRPKLFFKSSKKQNVQKIQLQLFNQTFKKDLKQKGLNNNFLTQLQPPNAKVVQIEKEKQKLQKQTQNEIFNCLRLNKMASKARQDELRKYIQAKQMEQQQWLFKLKKGRLLSENTKNYFDGSFNTALRAVKTSQGIRDDHKQRVHEQMKKLRIQTSMGNRKTVSSNQILAKQVPIPELHEIGSTSLMSNPFEAKLKKKKKNKK